MGTDVLVLCYHALSPTWTAALSTTPQRFERQLSRLCRSGYRGVTFTDAVTSRRRGERVLAVTFDDAYRSVIELGLPILERLGLPATVFAPTDFIGVDAPLAWAGVDTWLGGPDERELTPMSWSELRALHDAGWEIGSHTCSHPRLSELDGAALSGELERSKRDCERHLEVACTSVAYPYGDVDRRVVDVAHAAGYRAGAALPQGRLGACEALAWPRIGVYNVDGDLRFRLKASRLGRRVRRSRTAAGVLPILRRSASRLR